MAKIDSIKPKGKQMEVTFKTDVLLIEPDIFYQYHLVQGMEMDQTAFKQMVRDNQDLFYFRLAVQKLKKPLTMQEIKTMLHAKGAPIDVVSEVLTQLVARKYVDDQAYAASYIEQKKYQYGPNKIKEDLMRKGVEDDIVHQLTLSIDEKTMLNDLVPIKMKSIRNKSKKAMMNSVKTYFLSKGFTSEIVESVIISHLANYLGDETALLNQAYEKLMRQYQSKYFGYELNQVLIQKLYQKGFKMEDIRNIIEKHLDA